MVPTSARCASSGARAGAPAARTAVKVTNRGVRIEQTIGYRRWGSEAVEPEARRQCGAELPDRGLPWAERGEVVAVDDGIVRRLAHRLARRRDHPVDCREPRLERDRAPVVDRAAVVTGQVR